MSKLTSALDILQIDDLEVMEVSIPEWGKDAVVLIRRLSADEVIKFVADKGKDEVRKDAAIKLLILSVVDESGQRIFDESHIEGLKKKSMKAILRIQEAALEHNGMNDAKKVEQVKND